MSNLVEVKCSKCGEPICFIPAGYEMGVKTLCIRCAGKKVAKPPAKRIKTAAEAFARAKKGVRKDIHPTYMFRSATEANFARILQYLGIPFKFEEQSFKFDGYKNKPHMYLPDFETLKAKGCIPKGWIEVKGFFNAATRNKLRRFKHCHPNDAANMTIIIYRSTEKKAIEFCNSMGYGVLFYDLLTKEYAPLIPTWE